MRDDHRVELENTIKNIKSHDSIERHAHLTELQDERHRVGILIKENDVLTQDSRNMKEIMSHLQRQVSELESNMMESENLYSDLRDARSTISQLEETIRQSNEHSDGVVAKYFVSSNVKVI